LTFSYWYKLYEYMGKYENKVLKEAWDTCLSNFCDVFTFVFILMDD